MKYAGLPGHEAQRLVALEALRVVDTPPEAFFDQITDMARAVTGVKSAMVAMIDSDRKWLKSCSGGALGASARDISFCSHTILQNDVMWIEDSRLDERFWDNPLVTGHKQLNFYAGAPIEVGGFNVGTLCLNDDTPRAHDPVVAETLKRLADLVGAHLTARRMQLMSASVLSGSGDAVICADAKQRIIYWNEAAERTFGYSAHEAIGQLVAIIADPTTRQAQQARYDQALAGVESGEPRTFQSAGLRKDGSTLQVEITWASWADGDRPGLSLIIRDCSERVRAAEDLANALSRAEAASSAKTDFLAVMSHEIRTPLNGVLGMAQAMQAAELSQPQQERLKVLRSSGQVLLTLLDDLLDLAKIEAGKLELEFDDFKIEHLARNALASFAEISAQKGVKFSCEIDSHLAGDFKGDAKRIRQVLYNLTSNAVKFTQAGEVSVALAYHEGALLIRVSDTGIGIPARRLPGIFDKFEQADISTTRRFGGSGLGLSIVREVVHLMSGSIDVSSEEGRGSTFSVILPLARGPATLAAAEQQATNDVTQRAVVLRILAAEDNVVNQLVLRALLEPLGVELTIVDNGALALKAWESEHWDLILMDVQMPVMDGPGATRGIRAQELASGRKRTQILAVTANAMEHQQSEYRSAGMDGVVVKPIDAQRLYSAVEDALAREAGDGVGQLASAA